MLRLIHTALKAVGQSRLVAKPARTGSGSRASVNGAGGESGSWGRAAVIQGGLE
ncbi:MAG: hypothetical protein QF898_18990 [SAR202 cluster bacterium]|nr:hypothetical protein [SAR202 cluster bacterium]